MDFFPVLKRFIQSEREPNISNLGSFFPNNNVILPVTCSRSVNWIIFRIYGVDLGLPVNCNLKAIEKIIKSDPLRFSSIFLSASFLLNADQNSLDDISVVKERYNLKIFADFIPTGSKYDYSNVKYAGKIYKLIDTYFGPNIDQTDNKHEVKLRKNRIIKHFGFYNMQADIIAGSHSAIVSVSDEQYKKIVEKERKRYAEFGACTSLSGIMLSHLYNKQTEKYLFEDNELMQQFAQEGCYIVTDAIGMANIWLDELNISPNVNILVTDYYLIGQVLKKLKLKGS